jgi:hypothetical protein
MRNPHRNTITIACIHPFEISNARFSEFFIKTFLL